MADDKKTNGTSGGKDDNNKDVVAKTAGFVVFTGIALSIFKALWHKKPIEESIVDNTGEVNEESKESEQEKANESQKEANGFIKKFQKGGWKKKSSVTIEIFKGDTLWELSQKYGVSVDSIKAANGFSDDTIYAGDTLVIPLRS
uniref:TSA: Wollemia nobilis Ref_Wollemi_Transcript_2561_949 transcribed RNA sequence n=1 Tax=Wollemia nobilis TaxID=56998 RepID=A0A0C9RQA2_9CONI